MMSTAWDDPAAMLEFTGEDVYRNLSGEPMRKWNADNERSLFEAEFGMPRIVMDANAVITNDPCAICGARCDPHGTPDLFLAPEECGAIAASLVCDVCAKKYDPDLYARCQRIRAHLNSTLERFLGTAEVPF